jgi:hypothetical protein
LLHQAEDESVDTRDHWKVTQVRSKEITALIKEAECQGWSVNATAKGHYKWVSPLGNFFFSASTPSDYRAIKNIERDLARYGFIKVTKKERRNGNTN